MNKNSLSIYLKDHMAGSVAALELLDHLIQAATTDEARNFYNQLVVDFKADQKVLATIIDKIDAGEGAMRKAAGWIAEKASWLKLKASGLEEGQLGCFQALEGLLIGITGKKSLWKALEMKFAELDVLRGHDFPELIQFAEDQLRRVEQRRLEQAKVALS